MLLLANIVKCGLIACARQDAPHWHLKQLLTDGERQQKGVAFNEAGEASVMS